MRISHFPFPEKIEMILKIITLGLTFIFENNLQFVKQVTIPTQE